MSGFCGVAHFDGAPIDAQQLRDMASALAFRGPDRQDTWTDGRAGLGHALLATTPECAKQPIGLEGRAWIVADARIDARDALLRELRGCGRAVSATCSDAGLVLHAYLAWGDRCVEHLLGDFSFAIWDAPARRLFCAVDAFGIKPFFHARPGGAFVFGNTLDTLIRHPGVDVALDEQSIADFMLFEINQDPRATAFRGIRRLPAAGTLVVDETGERVSTYWTVPEARVVRRPVRDCVDEFRDIFHRAVDDRLRTRRAVVAMSGGLDSPAVAATAKSCLDGRGPFELRAHTIVYDRIMADEERRYSTIAASALGIPIAHHVADDVALYDRFDRAEVNFPDPFHGPDTAPGFDMLRAAARDARVVLTGFDGDTLLNESPRAWLRSLREEGRHRELLGALARFAWMERRVLPRRATRGDEPDWEEEGPSFPPWIEPGFAARVKLEERWAQARARPRSEAGDRIRPAAVASLRDLQRFTFYFDQYDAGITRLPLDVRHPFMDRRLVEFCLTLAPVPWCVRKTVLREAMRGVLPEPILRRPKTGLLGWPMQRKLAQLRMPPQAWRAPGLERYVRVEAVPAWSRGSARAGWTNLRPVTLGLWMRHMQTIPMTTRRKNHEIA